MPDLSMLQTWVEQAARFASDTRPLMATVAKSLDVAYREHFASREAEGNRQGFPPRHFWQREVARLISRESDAHTATLKIASPAFVHKVTGGRIAPKRAKALAIPRSPEAYRAGSPRISGLPLVFIPDLERRVIGWLVEHEVYSVKGRLRNANRLGRIHYLLVPYVDQPADPRAEPPLSALADRLQRDLDAWLSRLPR